MLCSVSKLAAGMELEGEETCIIRKPGQPVLVWWKALGCACACACVCACALAWVDDTWSECAHLHPSRVTSFGWKTLGRSVLSDQQTCIQSTQTRVTSFGEMTQDRLTDVYQGMNGTISYIIKNIVKMP